MATAYRILVPTDFSRCSDAALSIAICLSKHHPPAEILLTHVIEASVPVLEEELGVLDPEALRTKFQMLTASRQHDVPISTQVLHGRPAEEIIKLAEEKSVDIIVMGTHGHSMLTDLLVGSVAEYVIRRAPCTVLTMRVRPQSDVNDCFT